jgi:hypothetical protein
MQRRQFLATSAMACAGIVVGVDYSAPLHNPPSASGVTADGPLLLPSLQPTEAPKAHDAFEMPVRYGILHSLGAKYTHFCPVVEKDVISHVTFLIRRGPNPLQWPRRKLLLLRIHRKAPRWPLS